MCRSKCGQVSFSSQAVELVALLGHGGDPVPMYLQARHPFCCCILDEHEVDQEMLNLLGVFGATSPGLYAAVAWDNKELKEEFLKNVMGLDPFQQPDKALKAKFY